MANHLLSAVRNPVRLKVLNDSRLLDAEDGAEFDRLTRLASVVLHVPSAAISVLDRTHEHFRSAVGLPEPYATTRRLPLTQSICKYIVGSGEPLVVEDVRRDRSLRRSPAIEKLGVVAYAGMPLRSEGQTLGTFCVTDTLPRKWTGEEINILEDLAALAEEEIALTRVRTEGSAPVEAVAVRGAVEDLLSMRERYEALVEQSIVGITIIQDNRIRYVNPKAAEMFGYTQEELLNLPSVLDLTAERDRELVAENLRRRIEGEVLAMSYQFRGRRRDGTHIDVEVHGTRVKIEGAPAIVSVLLDVTERTLMEGALKASEERLRMIVETAQDAFIAVEEDGVITDWNAQAESMFGWSRTEAIGSTLGETIFPAPPENNVDGTTSDVLMTGSEMAVGERLELNARHRDGHFFPVEIRTTAIDVGSARVLCAFLHDISRRKQNEEALRSNEERFRSLVENSWDVILMLDKRGTISYITPSAEDVLGYLPEAMVGRTCDVLLHPDDADALREIFKAEITHPGATRHLETRLRHQDGSWRTAQVRAKVLRDATGESIAIVHIHDLTEQKRSEAEIQQRNAVIDLLRAVAVAANQAVTEEELLQACLDLICAHTDWPIGHAWFVDAKGKLTSSRIWHMDHPQRFREFVRITEETEFEVGSGMPGRVVERREPAWLQDATEEREFIRNPGKETGVRGAFFFPAIFGDQVPAVLEFFCDRAVEPDNAFLELVVEIGAQVGRAIERIRAEHVLKRSDERFQLVSRATNDGIWEWDISDGTIVWNDIAPRMLRYRPDEIGERIDWWYEHIHAEDRERVISTMHAVVSGTGDMWSSEYRFLRGDGSFATLLDRAWVVRDERGVAVRMIGCMLDVTERRDAEEAQRLLSHASGLLGASLDPFASLASVARYILPGLGDYCFVDLLEDDQLHRAAAAHVVPGKEALLAENEPRLLAAEPKGSLIAKAISTREPVLITDCSAALVKEVASAGEARKRLAKLAPVSLLVVPLLSRTSVLGVIGLATADSNRRYSPLDLLIAEEFARRCTLALENARLYRQAQDAVQAREEVLAVVSHDLRNPLSTIQMAASMLHDSNQERRSDNLKWMEVIRRALGGMERMIEDLLDLSSIDAGHFSIAPEEHDVSSMIAGVCETFQPLAEQASVNLQCEADPELSTVWIDSHRIQRVFSNLLGNALKFTPEGGSIVLRARQKDEQVCFSVEDSGPGIPAEQLPHVFNRYWQARKGDRRGAGLGLAIARGIVEQHGGGIWVESEPGEGAVFYFTIPIKASAR